MSKITAIAGILGVLRNLAKEAEADERKMHTPKHRKAASTPKAEKVGHIAHNTTKHIVHIAVLTWAGLPAILAFEAARPLWTKYVEMPITDITVGHDAVISHASETLTTIITYYLTN